MATFAVAGWAESVKQILGGMGFGGISQMGFSEPFALVGLFIS